MECLLRPRTAAPVLAALSSFAAAQSLYPVTGPIDPCGPGQQGLACAGQWSGPFPLGTSLCPYPCASGEWEDIGHAALVPVGEYAGHILYWSEGDWKPGYTSHLLDPVSMSVGLDHPPFPVTVDGEFCSGHTWVVRMVGGVAVPMLLAVGGVDFGSQCQHCGTSAACGLAQSYWFDATSAAASMWRHETPDLRQGGQDVEAWYPSVTTIPGPSAQEPTIPLVLGGSRTQGPCCHSLWEFWFSMSPLTAASWTVHAGTIDAPHTEPYSWLVYPRTMPLSLDLVIGTGAAGGCKESGFKVSYGYSPYGGNPVRLLTVPPHPTPHDDFAGPNPNAIGSEVEEVGSWFYSNAGILHTLLPGWTWPSNPGDVLQNVDLYYERDRVFVYGGTSGKGAVPTSTTGLATMAELLVDPALPPSQWQWKRKADAPQGRIFGNLVVLPDGTLWVGGGQSHYTQDTAGGQFQYRNDAARLWPGLPQDPGDWTVLAAKPNAPGFDNPTPRGYHHVGVLDRTGAVIVLGGRRALNALGATDLTYPDPEHTGDVYRPPYFFRGTRPGLGLAGNSTIHYGQTFCVDTRDPGTIDHAALIGIGSQTHHFDYGQRYVQLMVDTSAGTCPPGTSVRILPPPMPQMAPPGYYLLFLVDEQGRPSTGQFVLLTRP